MEKTQISLTAIMTAYLRGYHSKYDTPKIFDDFLACALIPEERRKLIEEGFTSSFRINDPEFAATCPSLTGALARVMPGFAGLSHTLARSRYTEDSLAVAVTQGVKQYVILGAGMDTFAFRQLDGFDCLQVFEVDHPAMQSFKRHRLEELAWEQPGRLHFIAMDFTRDSLSAELLKSPYGPQIKSFFSWLGVSMYLTRQEVLKTLHTIAQVAPSGSTVVFDYLDEDAFDPKKAASRIQQAMFMAKYAGEPVQTGFNPGTLSLELSNIGLQLVENLGPEEFQKRYFGGTRYSPCEHHYCARAEIIK